jgi:hypothetical protein
MSEKIKDAPERYLSYEEGCAKYRSRGGDMGTTDMAQLAMDGVPVVHRVYYMKHYLGVLLTAIEVLGLPEKQEKSFKNGIKRDFWKFVSEGFVVPPEIDDELSPTMEELTGGALMMTEAEMTAAGYDIENIKSDAEMLNI